MLVLLPFQGDDTLCIHTQGVALGYVLAGLSGRGVAIADNHLRKRRVRRWASPRAALAIPACGD